MGAHRRAAASAAPRRSSPAALVWVLSALAWTLGLATAVVGITQPPASTAGFARALSTVGVSSAGGSGLASHPSPSGGAGSGRGGVETAYAGDGIAGPATSAVGPAPLAISTVGFGTVTGTSGRSGTDGPELPAPVPSTSPRLPAVRPVTLFDTAPDPLPSGVDEAISQRGPPADPMV